MWSTLRLKLHWLYSIVKCHCHGSRCYNHCDYWLSSIFTYIVNSGWVRGHRWQYVVYRWWDLWLLESSIGGYVHITSTPPPQVTWLPECVMAQLPEWWDWRHDLRDSWDMAPTTTYQLCDVGISMRHNLRGLEAWPDKICGETLLQPTILYQQI